MREPRYDRAMSRATTYAAALAAGYVVVAGAYIAVSGEIAAALAPSFDELHYLELVKGLAFVAVTGLLLFALALVLFRRLARLETELWRSREALLVADRQAIPGLLAASIAHDFNNVLTVVIAGLDALREEVTDRAARDVLDDVSTAAHRGSELARRLSRVGRGLAAGDARKIDVAATVSETVDLLRLHTKARRRELRLDVEGPIEATAHPPLVQQIVTNLVVNALDATPERGRVLVRARHVDGAVQLEVHDDGPGVPAEARTKLFDPFYTTKAHGTGLGLLSVRTCAEMHGGSVEVASSDELGGACFRVLLGEPVASVGA